MKKKVLSSIFIVLLLIAGTDVEAVLIEGIDFPKGEVSFADEVVSFQKGTYAGLGYANPLRALGVPDGGLLADIAVSLGNNGTLTLGFTDNQLYASGDSNPDLWIFEAGPAGEHTDVSISENGFNWIYVGRVAGSGGIDIDATVSSGKYSYVKLYDVGNLPSTQPWAGSDINAVGAISSVPVPEPATFFMLGTCLIGFVGLKKKKQEV